MLLLFFYKKALSANLEDMKNNLTLAQNRFEPSRIADLQELDKRLRAGNTVLAGHIAPSPIFQALEELTMKTVRFTNFDYSLDGKTGEILVSLKGTAQGYRAVALQSDLFTKNKNLIDPVFSNLTLDEKGNVLFDLDFTVRPDFLNYRSMLKRETL